MPDQLYRYGAVARPGPARADPGADRLRRRRVRLAGWPASTCWRRLSHEVLATFDIDALLDYRSRRPSMIFVEDHWESYDEPALTLHLVRDTSNAPFLLLSGPEPDLQWERFVGRDHRPDGPAQRPAERRASTRSRWRCRTPGPTGITAHATRPELIAGYEPWLHRVQVPGAAGHLLEFRLGQRGRDAMGFAVHVPHYLAQSEYPAAAERLLTAVSQGDRAAPADRGPAGRGRGGPSRDRQADRPGRRGRRGGARAGGAVRRVRPGPGRHQPAGRRRPAHCRRPTNSAPSWSGSWPSSRGRTIRRKVTAATADRGRIVRPGPARTCARVSPRRGDPARPPRPSRALRGRRGRPRRRAARGVGRSTRPATAEVVDDGPARRPGRAADRAAVAELTGCRRPRAAPVARPGTASPRWTYRPR